MCQQYYADECTKNPIWLFQTKVRGNKDSWRTETVFSSREEGEAHGNARTYDWGEKNVGWRIWCVCCHDDRLAKAMSTLRPDLVDEYSSKH